MSKHRLLIVEDDFDIAAMLQIYFSSLGYEISLAPRGSGALEKTRQKMPNLIILDIMLPDIDGYEVCRCLRTQPRTSHIPIIFLTQKDERSDKIQGLELGADDYVTKPFDIEELRLRVQNAIARSERESLTDPRTNLPTGRLIEDQLRQIIRKEDWALMDIRINHFESFKEVYGFVASDDVLRFAGMLIGEVLDELGSDNDFIGHIGGDNFILITEVRKSHPIHHRLMKRFPEEVLTYYSYIDRQRGYLRISGEGDNEVSSPLMNLSIGIVSPNLYHFTDIREITELAAEARRGDKV
jgi:DNA-binding response OmpR family regulator